MLRLPELQHEFFRVLASAAGGDAAPALVAGIRGDDRLDASGRLGVYVGMYGARLMDVLREDYPRVAAILGADFAELARRYVVAHPSTHHSLRWFGRGFADFIAAHGSGAWPEFLADLARLEWARLAVFDAPDVALLEVETLRALSPEAWGTLRLRLIPAVEVLRVDWPVHRIWEAAEGEGASLAWSREQTDLRVWRQDDKVYQAGMDAVERTALAHVRAGDDFADLCNGLTAVVAPEAAAQTAGGLVLRWLADGVLAALADP